MIGWELALDIVSWIVFATGGVAVVVGALGLVRFPDFYTRLHAAGVTDTAGAELMILGMLLQAFSPEYDNSWQIAGKLGLLALLQFLLSPVATHAIAHAGWMVGFKPLAGADLRYEGDGE